MRKAYGAGYFVMCGRAYEPDLIVAWPTAEISVMGPEGGTNIVFRKDIAAAADPDAERAKRSSSSGSSSARTSLPAPPSSTTSSIRATPGRR